jgi:hypothetical protein
MTCTCSAGSPFETVTTVSWASVCPGAAVCGGFGKLGSGPAKTVFCEPDDKEDPYDPGMDRSHVPLLAVSPRFALPHRSEFGAELVEPTMRGLQLLVLQA